MSLFNENFYTDDFDQEMLDYVRDLGSTIKRSRTDYLETKYKYLKYGTSCDYFWTNNITVTLDEYTYLTKQQFKEKIGMTQKQFTKADLKDGMVVKYRGDKKDREDLSNKCSGLRLVVNTYLISSDNFNVLDDYDSGMSYNNDSVFTIDEVFEASDIYGGLNNIENWTLKSIWKRPEPVVAPTPSAEQLEIESIQAEMDKLSQRLSELKGKV